jgi:hypothetical protein
MIISPTASVATAADTASLLGSVSIIFKAPADYLAVETLSIKVAVVAKRVTPSRNIQAFLLQAHSMKAVRKAGLVIENRFQTAGGAGALTVLNSTVDITNIGAVKCHSLLADSATSAP